MEKDQHGRLQLDPHHAVIAAMGGTPDDAPDLDPFGDAMLSPERLRFEREQAYFNDIYLLAPVGYLVLGFDTTILQVNLVAADLLGIARDALPQAARTGDRVVVAGSGGR